MLSHRVEVKKRLACGFGPCHKVRREKQTRHKPTSRQFSLLHQICNFIPLYLMPCLARQTGVEDHAPHLQSVEPCCQPALRATHPQSGTQRRAAIEPVISHLKQQYRLARCFLKGFGGDQINLLLAAAAWNLRKWLRAAALFWLQLLRLMVGKLASLTPSVFP
jgi:hypothetical protein